jgi:hypothetical protein
MVDEVRLTAQGSAGAVLLGMAAAPDGWPGAPLGAAEIAVEVVVVAWGVFATVESPEPQPVNVAPINTATDRADSGSARHGSDHTSRTVPLSGARVWQACRARRAQLR